MLVAVSAAAVAALPAFLPPLSPPPLGQEFDCRMREAAAQLAERLLQGEDAAERLQAAADALRLHELCNSSGPRRPKPAPQSWSRVPLREEGAVWVDAVRGSDSATGDKGAPLRSLRAAVRAVRRRRRAAPSGVRRRARIVLHGGTHYLGPGAEPLQLGPEDSGLSIVGVPGEDVWVSGGVPLTAVSWKKWNGTAPRQAGANVWVARVGQEVVGKVRGLHTLHGDGLTPLKPRARWPNRDPLSGGMERGWAETGATSKWGGVPPAAPALQVAEGPRAPPNLTREYRQFVYGVGGPCAMYDPPGGYLCSHNASGGWYAHDTARGGPHFPGTLQPAAGVFPHLSRWGNASGAVLFSWTNQWLISMWELQGYNASDGGLQLGRGGFQGGRGWHLGPDPDAPGAGLCEGDPSDCGPVRIENLLAELDAPEEWYFDESTRDLYVVWNGTGSPADGAPLLAVERQVLMNVSGTGGGPGGLPSAPASNITLQNIFFRDAAPTYLEPHGVPSGGDWALERTAALRVEGSVGLAVSNCTFQYLEGNGLLLSGYNRGAVIEGSEFSWIGGSAMAAWGYSASPTPGMPLGVGYDGTAGNHPEGTTVVENVCREIGLHQKQSACWFQAKTSGTTLQRNLMYNAPRALINFNDGFGGGNLVENNLLFNSCRESADHGAINSWDRDPYVTGSSPVNTTIRRNFVFSNYYSWGVDNDDGSSHFDIESNVIYGGDGLKSDYMGRSKTYRNNLNVGARQCCFQFDFGWTDSGRDPKGADQWYPAGGADACEGNRCVLKDGAAAGWSRGAFALLWGCDASGAYNGTGCAPPGRATMRVLNNRVYSEPNATSSGDILCGRPGAPGSTVLPLAAAELACGPAVAGNTLQTRPDSATLLRWVQDTLGH
eukprot:TRINITY_DN29548_c0_g1_i1.p1 TRINITY_DN29548_c0_g1~~TRINITY_DN29548_c0_g1_i1.p1  ORF type:complete len:911 (+),score=184.09 TRINITY_DN29548_c0_g1_i1:73-2733(+)